MSTGLNCMFEEITPGVWYYLLEDYDAPKMSWDWREYATAYGPFSTEDEANEHLADCHANPGGAEIISFAQRKGKPIDAVLQKLVSEARSPKSFNRYRW